ncbi:hypothetical protein FL966_07700 [Caproiciproducens galactitolivorans]|uniref:hypothetical protein n=1 Tax=Caproiciproducens galactitolivorans TaxID=642589 RepID=UPI0010824132|nr:hypothetical protein [Caproiciproducens galactitolivorans]QEY34938.1 hypothetical protein FL966_07700 [Caproiciproducens galactitolivorans]
MSEAGFTSDYRKWAKGKGYHPSKAEAAAIYALAKDGVPTLAFQYPIIGDICRFHSRKARIVFAGIDALPYNLGNLPE